MRGASTLSHRCRAPGIVTTAGVCRGGVPGHLHWRLGHQPAEQRAQPQVIDVAEAVVLLQLLRWILDYSEAARLPPAFAAAFRREVGSTPADYLLRWRVSLAQGRLRQGLPLKAVAAEVGYDSAASFTRAYRSGSAG